MKVAFIVEKFPNISETFILDEIVGAIKRGVDVDIYAYRRGTAADIHPSYTAFNLEARTIYCVPTNPSRLIRLLLAIPATLLMVTRNPSALLRSALTRKRGIKTRTFVSLARAFVNVGRSYDVVHAHFGPNGIRGEVLRHLGVLRAPLVTTFHGYDVTSFVEENGLKPYEQLAKGGDRFIAVSASIARLLARLNIPGERTRIMPLGVDCSNIEDARAMTVADSPLRVVSVGRFVEKKGLEYGIRAVVEAHENGVPISYELIGDGGLRPSLERLITELNAASYITLLGYKDQAGVATVLSRSDVMLVPSVTAADGDQEAMPIVIKEAMARGLPVIATRHAGIPEIVEDGVTGLLSDERDVQSLTTHLTLLAADPGRRFAMGRAGKSVILAQFDNERLIDELIEFYHELVGGKSLVKSA